MSGPARRYVLVGGGGLAHTICDVIAASGSGQVVALLDDRPGARGEQLFGATVEGTFADLGPVVAGARADAVLLAIGGLKHMLVRAAYLARLERLGLRGAALIHPAAVLGQHAVVGEGSVVGAGAVLGPEVGVGAGCVVYSGCVVEHECVLEDNVYLAPGVLFGGRARVGRDSYVGIGAKIADRVAIGAGSIVGAGALVLRDVPPGVVCFGAPAKVIGPNDRYRSAP